MWPIVLRFWHWSRLVMVWTGIMRLLTGELWAKREPVLKFDTPQDVCEYVKAHFAYRGDEFIGAKSDWITDPEVMQARLNSPDKDGDCDDIHTWACAALALVPGVSRVVLLEVGFGKATKGAHAVAVYTYDDRCWLFDYTERWPLGSYDDGPANIARRYGDKSGTVRWWVWKQAPPDWTPIAICREFPRE